MNYFFSLFILLFIHQLTYSQTAFNGQIKSEESDNVIPYVNIGLADKGIGTISDQKGNFVLKIPSGIDEKEIVTFSCIGYKTKGISIEKLHHTSEILLKKDTVFLETVSVTSENHKEKNPKPKKLGKAYTLLAFFHNNFFIYGEVESNHIGKERGMILPVKKNCLLQSLNFHVSSNEYRFVKFRLHFYTIENGEPAELINDQDIIFKIENQFRGWHKVDLKPYSIHLDKSLENVGVSLQWIDSENTDKESKFFSISATPLSSARHIAREKVLGKWKVSKFKLNFYLDYLEEENL
ncbi:carboxypeptidase-like regulatory domain-containing protein [Flammeovirga aprica]|uniref:Carboxypeptidase-like regulatory domain-containing protein n=1 Tax=Flammeovirga aprica JL-4 TaxID=694437 RepID=A0A7X9XB87_9BACT|nr:carboxypeptidase-like regulatory domain-containing protein [Flammeovirga aprica]NME70394.1 carboxypeptidase-like regulatory domain-containing protein [Flammeovirga aprica JL-4]